MKKTFIFLTLILLFSCKKEGCTDITATNYNSSAKKNDGSCKFNYTSDLIFWQDSNTADSMYNYEYYDGYNLYVDGVFHGSCTSLTYLNSSPNCGEQGIITYSYFLGSDKSKFVNYEIRGNDGTVIWFGSLNLSYTNCSVVRLH